MDSVPDFQVNTARDALAFLSQTVYQAAGVSIATIVLIERYGHVPGADVRARLAEALGVSESVIWADLETEE